MSDKGTVAPLFFACKSQSAPGSSSGETELIAADEALGCSADDLKQVYESASDLKSATTVARRGMVPCILMLEALGTTFASKDFLLDASVAIVVIRRGFSMLMRYMKKTVGVDFGVMKGMVEQLDLSVCKCPSDDNVADVMTKPLEWSKMYGLLKRVGYYSER